MNFDNLLIRCHANSKIMTEPKTKADKDAGKLSATAISYLQELYIEMKYGRKKEIGSKYIDKGIQQEEAGITLYNLEKCKGRVLRKNTERVNNAYLTGEPDGYFGDTLIGCEEGFDIKNSWSIHTFPMFETKLNPDYEWQNLGYMAITGAKKWTTVFTLCNCSAEQILSEKRSAYYALGQPADGDATYLQKCIEIEKNMIFDMSQFKRDYPGFDLDCKDWCYDIPRSERVKEFVTLRDDDKILSIYEQVRKCRRYMNETFGSIIMAEHDAEVGATIIEGINH